MGRACRTYGKENKCKIKFWSENPKEKDLHMDVMGILKWI
jgi:hypothetical protein